MHIESFACSWSDSNGQFTVRARDLDIPAGAVTVLMGANGSGKTTFFRGLAEHAGITIRERRIDPTVRFYYVHQQPERALFPSLSVRQAFYALVAARCGGFWNLRRVPRLADIMVGLPSALQNTLDIYRDYEVSALSGGYKALVAVAAAAVAFLDCGLLLDEPSAGLDPSNRQLLATELRVMAKSRETPVIVSTHQQDFAAALGGVRLQVIDGNVVALSAEGR